MDGFNAAPAASLTLPLLVCSRNRVSCGEHQLTNLQRGCQAARMFWLTRRGLLHHISLTFMAEPLEHAVAVRPGGHTPRWSCITLQLSPLC